jgi:membrane associated rhomboid family serine protease
MPLIGMTKTNERYVLNSCRRANVLNFFRVRTPGTNGDAVHPIFAPEMERCTYDVLLKNRRRVNTIALAYSILIPAVMLFLKLQLLGASFFLALIAIYLVGKYEVRFIYSDISRLKSKVQFYTDCIFHSRKPFILAGSLFVTIGFFQILGISLLGSKENFLEAFGLVLPHKQDHGLLRFFSAQFIHTGALHWSFNAVAFAAFTTVGARIFRSWTIPLAIAVSTLTYSVIGLASPYLALPHEGIVGFSSGVAGLGGMILMASLKGHPKVPRDFLLSFALQIFLSMFAFAFVTNTSSLVHLIGLALGMLCGMIIPLDYAPSAKVDQNSSPPHR